MYAHMKDPAYVPNTSRPDFKDILNSCPESDVYSNQNVLDTMWRNVVFGMGVMQPLKGALSGKGGIKELSVTKGKHVSKPNKLEKIIDKMEGEIIEPEFLVRF